MSAGWYRSNGSGTSHIVHEGRCVRRGNAHAWAMVEGLAASAVLARVAEVPWLRMCEACADRLKLPADDPARFSDADRESV